MTFLFANICLLLISAGSLVVVVSNTDPLSSSFIVIFSFFVLLFLMIFSLVNILTLVYSAKKNNTSSRPVALRRSLLVALALVGTVVFSSIKVLNLLSAFSFLLAIILLELFFASRKKEKTKL